MLEYVAPFEEFGIQEVERRLINQKSARLSQSRAQRVKGITNCISSAAVPYIQDLLDTPVGRQAVRNAAS